MRTYIYAIYACSFSFIHRCCEPNAQMRTCIQASIIYLSAYIFSSTLRCLTAKIVRISSRARARLRFRSVYNTSGFVFVHTAVHIYYIYHTYYYCDTTHDTIPLTHKTYVLTYVAVCMLCMSGPLEYVCTYLSFPQTFAPSHCV